MLTVDNHTDGPYLYLRLLQEDLGRAAEVLSLLKMNGGNSTGTGIACVNDLSKRRKRKTEEKHPELLLELHTIMAPVSQAESHLKTDLAYTKMTATAVRSALLERGLPDGAVPTLRTLSNILNRQKYRLRRVVKSQVQKKRVYRPDLRERKAGERAGGC